jgi:magnesium chelatase family protein
MIGQMHAAVLNGFGATAVLVEVDSARGLPSFTMVGLPENSVKEARVRVQSALTHAGFEFPKTRISVNLAPADLQKSGASFDLAIALALLQACGTLAPKKVANFTAIGELSLTGEIRPVRGMLALAESIKEQGVNRLVVAPENGQEASLIQGMEVRTASRLAELSEALLNDKFELLEKVKPLAPCSIELDSSDMSDVVGQEDARRALLLAAVGEHNLLFVGGPGCGKSMMAYRLPGILPPLTYEESITLTKIYSIAGLTMAGELIHKRPFRAPHHSTTRAGLVGGGSSIVRPGEISLASFGVLFLDELLEFPRTVLEVLRQPLETGIVTLCRANHRFSYPAQFSLLAALNPCPCGHFGQQKKHCLCSPQTIERYQSRLSGPLIDRMDLHVNVPPVDLRLMTKKTEGESSSSMRERVLRARSWQKKRTGQRVSNGKMTSKDIKQNAQLSRAAEGFLLTSAEKLSLSARSFDRLIRVARSIADLDESEQVHEQHLREAFHFRPSFAKN